jgi:ribonuclease D
MARNLPEAHHVADADLDADNTERNFRMVSPLEGLVTDSEVVHEIAHQLRLVGSFALDLEFMSEERYVPELALVQVAWQSEAGPLAAALDPLAVDVRPIVELVEDPSITTILHSGQADLSLLAARFGVAGQRIVDTQVAAAFLGMGEQIGYAPFVQRTLGLAVDKGGQFTEWLRRPLSDDQLRYALDDVLHLLPAWIAVERELRDRGRLAWVTEECARFAAGWSERIPPESMYRRVSGWATLRPRQQGALRGIAAWREREALAQNRPPSRFIADRTMLELARRPPRSPEGLRDVRGMSDGVARRYGGAIIEALQQGEQDPPAVELLPKPLPPAAQAWAGVLGGLVQAHCRDADIAARFVASRSDLEAVALWWFDGDREVPPEVPLLHGWRRDLAGEVVLRWLQGSMALLADADSPFGFRLVDLPPQA